MPAPLIQLPDGSGLWGWLVSFALGAFGLWKAVAEPRRMQAERQKLEAERLKLESERLKLDAERAKTDRERENAEVLGTQLYEELQQHRLTELGAFLKELQLQIDQNKANYQNLEDSFTGFRSAVLEFIGVISAVLPEMSEVVRLKVQEALTKLNSHDGWQR